MARYSRNGSSLQSMTNSHFANLKESLEEIIPFDAVVENHTRNSIEWTLNKHGWYNRTRYQAALHETGHYVAFMVFGYSAYSAKIWGTPGGYGGWQGEVIPYCEQWGEPQRHNPSELLSRSKIILAGLWTESILGCSDTMSPAYEILEFHILVAMAANMQGVAYPDLLDQTMQELSDFVGWYDAEILEIAHRLDKRKKIFTRLRSIKAPLESIREKTASGPPLKRFLDDRALRDAVASLPSAKYLVKHLIDV